MSQKGYRITEATKLSVQVRRRKIVTMITNRPSISQGEIGEALGVNRSTISRDLKSLSEELKIQNQEGWLIHRERVLREIIAKQVDCEHRLAALKDSPRSGSRWMEEWRKLKEMEARILGLYSADRLIITEEQTFDKDQEDAAIDAALKAAGFDENVIDITPALKRLEPTHATSE